MHTHHRSLVWLIVAATLLAGCGDDGEGSRPPRTATPAATPTRAPTATTAPTTTLTPTATVISPRIVSVSPSDTVDTFDFEVRLRVEPPAVAADEVRASINGFPLELSGGPEEFTAQVRPGPPLRDENVLTATYRGATRDQRFDYLPPKARARRVSDPGDLITGPNAQGRLGDYLLENAVARFLVQDAHSRQLANVGTYGGNLIDAELVGRPGRDEFFEIQPMVNVETVIHATRVEIVNDGQDGTAAVVRSCGPDDTLDFINPSSSIKERVGIDIPATVDDADYEIEGCTEYALEPGKPYVRMTTTIRNETAEPIPLYVGDYMAGGGQLDPWLSSVNGNGGIGELIVNTVNALSYIGFGAGTGVDYGYIPIPRAESPVQTSDILATAGVAVALHSASIPAALVGAPSTFVVPANGQASYTRLFSVGDGSGGNAMNVFFEATGVETGTLRGCVTLAGAPAPRVRVAVGNVVDGRLAGLTTHFVTREDGCYEGRVPPGTYGAAASRGDAPFEQNETRPPIREVTIVAGATTTQDFALPGTSRLRVAVTDEQGRAVPARVMLVGFDPSPEPRVPTQIAVGEATTWLFRDLGDDGLPFGIARAEYAGADGVAEFDAKPGEYQLFVSRGTEYSAFERRVNLVAGETTMVAARIARVVDTTGFVSSDFHVHGIHSSDSRINRTDRVLQYAGEGIENIVMTEHGGRTDLNPTIEALGLTGFVHATIGEETTTWEYGHYNGYPYDLVPGHQNGGAVDWARAAEPGRDFVRYGAYGLTPAELDMAARTGPGSRPSTIVQANHFASTYGPLQIDTAQVPPRSAISAEGKLAFRLDPSVENLYHHFAALEVWNGDARSHQENFLNNLMGIWFNELNQGLISTGTAVTDSHGFFNLNAAGAQTWTAAPSDEPADIDPDQVATQVAAGRATLGQGAFATVRLVAADGSGGSADLTLGGNTLVATSNRAVTLEVRVQSPLWAPFDRIEVYANASTFPTGKVGTTNVFYSATPTLTHRAGTDFEVRRVNVAPAVAGGERYEATDAFQFPALEHDTWFVVIVRGTDGISRPMFPLYPRSLEQDGNDTLEALLDGNLGERGTLAMAVTNPLYADVDGTPGFQAVNAPRR